MKTPPSLKCLLLTCTCLLTLPAASDAAVSVMGMTTFDGMTSRYTYSYSVTNSGSEEELVQVFFPVSPSADLLGLTAPSGFAITFNDVEGIVNFRWDDDDLTMETFAPESTVSGFSFTSPIAPGTVTFTAQDIVQDFTGSTVAPIPEPSTALLALLALPWTRRRRQS